MYTNDPVKALQLLGTRLEVDPPKPVIATLTAVVYADGCIDISIASEKGYDPFRLESRISFELRRVQSVWHEYVLAARNQEAITNHSEIATPQEIEKTETDLFEKNYRFGGL